MSSNATEVSNSGQLTQFLVYGGITGITLQTSTISVICVSLRLADPKRHRRYWIVASLMLAYNAGSIVLVISFAGLSVFGQSTCLMGYFLANGATHFSLFFFDCFILYKACALAGNNNYIVAASILFLVNRLCWGIADIVVSSCIWGNGACNYNQNVVTGWGYQTADLICDAFSSLVSIGFSSIGWDLGSLASLLLSENEV
ncbi:hypothetical protein BC830DRAFT_274537 [Chytriomyces sp. MP71]|nr:hypothetical protein BC830DRAFT_274537 [Chytriomyces sp. MP71]